MASPSSPDKKGKPTPGVRGPGGPPPPPSPSAKAARPPTPASMLVSGKAMPTKPASPARRRFEEISYPIVQWLNGLPRFVIIVAPGLLLFLCLIQTGSLAWLGGVLLLIVAAMLAWLTALSWPVIATRSKIVRVAVILVVLGFATFKFLGRM
jgi:hypothetical protein